MRKLGWVIIILIFGTMLWTIGALLQPDTIGAGTKTFFVDIVGVNIVSGVTGLSHEAMLWGSTGFPQAIAIVLGSGIFFMIVGGLFYKFLWSHRPTWFFGGKPQQTAMAPKLQDQLATQELYVPKQQTPPPQEQVVKVEEKK